MFLSGNAFFSFSFSFVPVSVVRNSLDMLYDSRNILRKIKMNQKAVVVFRADYVEHYSLLLFSCLKKRKKLFFPPINLAHLIFSLTHSDITQCEN
jgi:hypothetical protein